MMILESVLHSKTKCVYFSLLLVPHWEFNCAGSIVMLRGRALIISLPMERNIYICIPGALYIMTNTALFLAGDRKNLLAIVQKRSHIYRRAQAACIMRGRQLLKVSVKKKSQMKVFAQSSGLCCRFPVKTELNVFYLRACFTLEQTSSSKLGDLFSLCSLGLTVNKVHYFCFWFVCVSVRQGLPSTQKWRTPV